ncbi:MAG: pitrilysin family protein [Gemmatimonadota bacterium]|nr:MAG: pitrilysin family protein [Gemmatimonadota bacterium]
MRWLRMLVVVALAAGVAVGFAPQSQTGLDVEFEKYTLDNGLDVVLHEDRSDPITAVAVLYHVGSNREEPGRTGFAHLFEHMMFQSSQHVAEDQFFKKIQAVGGTLNGGTSNDNTIYFEIVPNNALEMALWLESDRMGYLLPTVTQAAFLNQQDVVQNEKRQRVDNVPYGHTGHIIGKMLYPEDHQYNWSVIGSFEDLANATLDDIQSFFTKWYGPNNATLVVAGDFDRARTKEWIEKYFGELPSPENQPDPEPRAAVLTETKRAFYEDNFARSPELNMVFPSVEQYNGDAYALRFLGLLLSDGKKAPLYKVIVEEGRLAPQASAFQRSLEIAGTFRVRIRSFPGKNLTDVENAVKQAFDRFEADGFTERDLDRIKAQVETGFYNSISSVLGKAFQLASYNEFAGSPGFIGTDIENLLSVSAEDVWRVYNEYVKDKPYVLTSFVPKGQVELVAANSERFPIEEEEIATAGVAGKQPAVTGEATVEPLPSSFDRSVQPPNGPSPALTVPEIWTHTYANGMRIFGIEQDELPLVQFSLTMKGGLLLDDITRVGVANVMTDIMMEGTKNKTPLELEEAIDELGASLRMFTGRESITIRANTLRSRLDGVYDLFEEILLEPRWDETEFERIKRETVETINRRGASPARVAGEVFSRLLYGEDHILANPTMGTPDIVSSLTIDDVRGFYEANYSPSVAHIGVVGDISKEEAIALFEPLERKWAAKEVEFPVYPEAPTLDEPTVYFVDVPGARQSEIRVGHLGLAFNDPDYYAATVMNYPLGGSFNGRLNMILREEKGYTYGARSGFSASSYPGSFMASAGVRSNVTLESVQIFKDELEKYREGVTAEDLTFTKSALIQSNARRFETLGALLGTLTAIGTYDLPFDYVKQREEVVRNMTLDRLRNLAETYILPDRMIYLVVGDAKTQFARLRELGLGEPILLDRQAKRVPNVVF